MKSRRRNVSKGRLTKLRRNTTEPIPVDLIIEILSRLPLKSVARCQCVSKLWASILGLPYFTELFLTKASARPQLLFAFQKDGKLLFLSSPQPQNLDDENSPAVTANIHMSFSYSLFLDTLIPVNGLVCLTDQRILKGKKNTVWTWVICNPSTGQSLTLPKIKTRKRFGKRSYFGYDPIEKQFKVLSMTWSSNVRNTGFEEYHVLTLGTQEPSWRMINCCRPHFSADIQGICINGVFYYTASVNKFQDHMVACFDVRSEKFRFIQVPGNLYLGTLINYNGKLGSLEPDQLGSDLVSRRTRSISLYVLEDAEKQDWLKHTYILPASWWNTVGRHQFGFVGVTRKNVIVLTMRLISGPVYVIYYNIEKNTAIRVQIKGIKPIMHQDHLPELLHTFLDHVEDVKLMQMF